MIVSLRDKGLTEKNIVDQGNRFCQKQRISPGIKNFLGMYLSGVSGKVNSRKEMFRGNFYNVISHE